MVKYKTLYPRGVIQLVECTHGVRNVSGSSPDTPTRSKLMEQKRIDRITHVAKNRLDNIIVVLEDIHDPHNASAILRTCDALGIQDVWFIFEKEERYNPKRVGKASSSSANKWLDFRIFDSASTATDELKSLGYRIVVTALTNTSVSLLEFRTTHEKIAVVVGNEHEGVSDTMLRKADDVLTIPMWGFVQSMNVSVATAIVLWEVTRQRRSTVSLLKPFPEHRGKLLADLLKRGEVK